MLGAREEFGGHVMEMQAVRRQRHVVVADDDADMRALIATRLRYSGLDVVEVADGESLLALLASSSKSVLGPPDLLITDVNMPGLTGLDAVAATRRLLPALPIVVISAFGGPLVRTRAAALGAAAFFDKPLAIADLHDAAIELLGY
jgi:CheY-like chemotaxis protein